MYNSKSNAPKTPDFSKLQAVRIDHRTTIYIAAGENAQEAKERYLERQKEKKY
ncbi:MAG TPA: hypothetical protein VJY41_14625 [Prolixibacteraceae bacterium]|nr:hypothetical protein [Prolixibacteraceae bacterium]